MAVFKQVKQVQEDGYDLERLVKPLKATTAAIFHPKPASSTRRNARWNSRLAVTVRTLGLRLVPSFIAGDEERKIALRKDRWTAAIRCLIHIPPLAGALTLIYLNLTWYELEQEKLDPGLVSSTTTTALQFGAKLHEMTMVASLAMVVMSYIRHYITSDTGVPFGATLAGARVQNLAYLWSPDLWGSMRSSSFGRMFRFKLALLLILISTLTATVGPASAACMIPRYTYWDKNVDHRPMTISLHATREELYPTNLSGNLYSFNTDAAYPELTTGNFAKPVTWAQEARNTGTMAIAALIPQLTNIWVAIFAQPVGTGEGTPLRQASGVWTWGSITYTLSLACQGPSTSWGVRITSIQVPAAASVYSSAVTKNPAFAGDVHHSFDAFSAVDCTLAPPVLWNLSEPAPPVSFDGSPQHLVQAGYDSILAAYNSTPIGVYGLAFVTIPNTNTSGAIITNWESNGSMLLTPCKFQLGWFPTTVRAQSGILTSGGTPQPDDPDIIQATADLDWLATANPQLPSANMSAFAALQNALKTPTDVVLSTLLTVTLAKMSLVPDRCGTWTCGGGLQDVCYYGDYLGQECPRSPDASTFPLAFPVYQFYQGWGYGPNVLAIKISLAILLLYCMIAFAHIVYSLWTGVSSSAWDTIMENIALAINSRPAAELQNTCAGIQTGKVFEHKVRIAATHGGESGVAPAADRTDPVVFEEELGTHLELLFPSNVAQAVSKVFPNRNYGSLKERVD